MSYDLRIWSTHEPRLDDLVGASDGSQPVEQGRGWLINATGPLRVEPEDVPREIAETLPGIAYLVELTLEPIGAPASALAKLRSLAKKIASAGHGVVEDPQSGSMTLGTRVQRLSALGATDDATLLTMGFWYEAGVLSNADGVPELLQVLMRHLPEALPARYGEYEPPQFRLDRNGLSHLEAFMRQHWRALAVYYPSAPVAHLEVSVPETIGPSQRGYRSGRLVIDIDADAIAQPGWQAQIAHAWRAIVRLAQPYYSDVRQLRYYKRGRGRYWVTSVTERHPICSWWWSGIPTGSTYAIALGNPYLDLWSDFVVGSEKVDAISIRTASDWGVGASPLLVPNVPVSIRQVQPEFTFNSNRAYPDTWPFASPRI